MRQVTDLATLFGDGWGWVRPQLAPLDVGSILFYVQVGVGRDDGVAAGEFSPIFYKKYVNHVRKYSRSVGYGSRTFL